MAYLMDFFAGTEKKVLSAIGTKVQYPAYVFIRDTEDSLTGRLAFVDQNNILKYIRGENKQQVLKVDILPSVANGDMEVLYIMGDALYLFNGESYVPIHKDYTAIEIEALTARMDAIETTNEELLGKITELETETDTIITQLTEIEEKIVAAEKNSITFVELE